MSNSVIISLLLFFYLFHLLWAIKSFCVISGYNTLPELLFKFTPGGRSNVPAPFCN